MGNKCDKVDERTVSEDLGRKWCRDNGGIPFYETSAKEDIKVGDAFYQMIERALEN